jgi:hypothetical protein
MSVTADDAARRNGNAHHDPIHPFECHHRSKPGNYWLKPVASMDSKTISAASPLQSQDRAAIQGFWRAVGVEAEIPSEGIAP